MKVQSTKWRFKRGLTVYSRTWKCTTIAIVTTLLSIILIPCPGAFAQTEQICDTKYSERDSKSPEMEHTDKLFYCKSTQPINWMIQRLRILREKEMELSFKIETKLVSCDSRKIPPGAANSDSTTATRKIPYYFISTLTPTKWTLGLDFRIDIFCGTFTPGANLETFPWARLEFKNGNSKVTGARFLPTTFIQAECEDSSVGLPSSGSGTCPCDLSRPVHCENLVECRFLAHSHACSTCSACRLRRVPNVCNVTPTPLSLPDPNASFISGGFLRCESIKSDSYIPFFPTSQTLNATHQMDRNVVPIQILGNEAENYQPFLNLSIQSPENEREIERKTGGEIVCRGPAFLFIQGFLWNVEFKDNETNSENSFPKFTISAPRTKILEDGQKYASSTLRILADDRKTNVVVNVTCQAFVNDRPFFVQSNLAFKLVYRPKLATFIYCPSRNDLQFACLLGGDYDDRSFTVTWHNGSGYELDRDYRDSKTGDTKYWYTCSQNITCTATWLNGVSNSHTFNKEPCEETVKRQSCTGTLQKEKPTTTTQITTTQITTTTTEEPTTTTPKTEQHICATKNPQKKNRSPKIWREDDVLHCESTQPINWRIKFSSQSPTVRENATGLPFKIETKLITCDSWDNSGDTNFSPASEVVNSNSTSTTRVPYYFKSTLTVTKRIHTSSAVDICCSSFTAPSNSNSSAFSGFKLVGLSRQTRGKFEITNLVSQINSASSEAECDDSSDLREGSSSNSELPKNRDSNGTCVCQSPKILHCENLLECRLLAHWKFDTACEVRRVENLCNETSLDLQNSSSSETEGGILLCESTNQGHTPYLLFFPTPQNSNASSTTNEKEAAASFKNLAKFQILGNSTGNFGPALKLSILKPKNENEMTWKTGVEIECKGPAFLFLQGFLWTVEVKDNEAEFDLLPKFNALTNGETENSGEDEKYVGSTLRILPDTRNQSLALAVNCQAFVNDRPFFVQSNLTFKLEVYKPKIKTEIECVAGIALNYFCTPEEADDVFSVTWHPLDQTVQVNKKEPHKIALTKCGENLTCTATLRNGVSNSHTFTKKICKKYVVESSCAGLLENVATNSTDSNAETATKDDSLTIGLTVAAVIFALAFIVLVYKHFQTRKELRLLTANEIDEFVKGDPGKLKDVEIQGENVHLLPFNKKYEVSDSDYSIDHGKILGSGEFGTVYGGTLRQIPVAIKTTKSETDVEIFKAFLKEIKVMTFIGEHENVVQLLGTVTNRIRERVVFIIVELAAHGSLHSFLREHQNNFVNSLCSSQLLEISPDQINSMEYANTSPNGQLTVSTFDLVKWCGQIASGMAHLASKKIIHGDLAARNILLFDDYTAKISDFGLARQLYTSPNYVKKQQSPLPWRIMAPESLKNLQFSTKSDVWAFGVLAWEIFSLAAVPYAGLSWTHDFVDRLEQDLRLQKPKWATNDIYENMCSCWHPVANCRPDFEHLEQFYKEILQHPANESETVYLQMVSTTGV